MKKGYIITIAVVIVALSLLLIFWDKIKEKTGKGASADKPATEGVSVFPLRKGSQGEEVSKLQEHFNKSVNFYYVLQPLKVDGVFGPLTEGMAVTITGEKTITEKYYNDNIV